MEAFKLLPAMLLFLFISSCISFSGADVASVTYDEKTEVFSIHDKKAPAAVAWATFTNAVNETGWAYLEVYTSGQYADTVQAYAAGLVEGYISHSLITLHWHNTMEGYCATPLSKFCKNLKHYLEVNFAWTNEKITEEADIDPYWHQVALYMNQMNGVGDGYLCRPTAPRTQVDDVLALNVMIQLFGDIMDLKHALVKVNSSRVVGVGHCSVLVKILEGQKDLYVSHDTWTTYQSMIRVLKKYDFRYRKLSGGSESIPGQVMTFSSYPGLLMSGDDFYLISSGLVTLETTISNNNSSLWSEVKPAGTVLETVRSMVANRLATSGSEWSAIFAKYNSGTYNNQWMVVDYKRFKPGRPLAKGRLFVLEQLPGLVVYEDLTHVLSSQRYWPSYNVAYFPQIFNLSGQWDMVKKYGDWFSYNKTARANIFRRDHSKVKDLESMTRLMRYNDFKNDPLSRCNCTPPYSAFNAISARNDLNPANGTYPFELLGHNSLGGIDMKLTSPSMFKRLEFIAIAGPTTDQQPPFQWSKSDLAKTLPHRGHPDVFNFKPVLHKWGRRVEVST